MRPPRLTRLQLIGIFVALAVLAFLFTRMGGGDETDALALPSLEQATDDELDGFDDFGGDDAFGSDEDLIGEPTDEDIDLTELDSNAGDDLFAVEDGPEADGIDPLTGRIDGDDPEGPAAFVDGESGSGNQIDTGLDGRDGVVVVDTDGGNDDGVIVVGDGSDNDGVIIVGDGGRDDGIIVVDGDGGRDDSVIIVDGDVRGSDDGVIIVDGDGGRDDSVIIVDADGYSFADDDDGDTVVILGDSDIEADAPELSSEPPAPTFDDVAPEAPAVPQSNATMAEQADIARARALLSQWLATKDVSGARIGFSFPDGSRTYLTAGTEEDGAELDPNGEFLATSVTKTMTASIIFNLVSEGVLELDTPAPPLGAVADFGYNDTFTIRQLLQHTSGLAPYQSSPNWAQDMELNALTALQLSDDVPLENTPGAERGYSNSGYLYLGLLAEQFTGTPFHELIQNRIAGPLELDATRIDATRRPGWVGYSAGGLISSVPDLLSWGSALYRDGSVLEQTQLDTMLDVDNEHSTGLGANVICPCGLDNGRLWYTSIGHDGGSVTLQFSPADNMITSAKFTESFWTQDLSQRDVHQLLRELRAVLTGG